MTLQALEGALPSFLTAYVARALEKLPAEHVMDDPEGWLQHQAERFASSQAQSPPAAALAPAGGVPQAVSQAGADAAALAGLELAVRSYYGAQGAYRAAHTLNDHLHNSMASLAPEERAGWDRILRARPGGERHPARAGLRRLALKLRDMQQAGRSGARQAGGAGGSAAAAPEPVPAAPEADTAALPALPADVAAEQWEHHVFQGAVAAAAAKLRQMEAEAEAEAKADQLAQVDTARRRAAELRAEVARAEAALAPDAVAAVLWARRASLETILAQAASLAAADSEDEAARRVAAELCGAVAALAPGSAGDAVARAAIMDARNVQLASARAALAAAAGPQGMGMGRWWEAAAPSGALAGGAGPSRPLLAKRKRVAPKLHPLAAAAGPANAKRQRQASAAPAPDDDPTIVTVNVNVNLLHRNDVDLDAPKVAMPPGQLDRLVKYTRAEVTSHQGCFGNANLGTRPCACTTCKEAANRGVPILDCTVLTIALGVADANGNFVDTYRVPTFTNRHSCPNGGFLFGKSSDAAGITEQHGHVYAYLYQQMGLTNKDAAALYVHKDPDAGANTHAYFLPARFAATDLLARLEPDFRLFPEMVIEPSQTTGLVPKKWTAARLRRLAGHAGTVRYNVIMPTPGQLGLEHFQPAPNQGAPDTGCIFYPDQPGKKRNKNAEERKKNA